MITMIRRVVVSIASSAMIVAPPTTGAVGYTLVPSGVPMPQGYQRCVFGGKSAEDIVLKPDRPTVEFDDIDAAGPVGRQADAGIADAARRGRRPLLAVQRAGQDAC